MLRTGNPVAARAACYRALDGVGDASLGEWLDDTSAVAVHLRRRLSRAEELVVGPACDVRGTAEAHRRLQAMLPTLRRVGAAAWARQEARL